MIKVETNIGKVLRDLEKIPGRIDKAAEKTLIKETKTFVKDIKAEQFSGRRGRKWLNVVTGRAISSWRYLVSGTRGDLKIRIWNYAVSPKGFPYVAHHETTTRRLSLRKRFAEMGKRASRIVAKAIGQAAKGKK